MIPLRYDWYSYNIPPQNIKTPLILERPTLRIYVILMMIVFYQNPVEESGGDFFRSCFFTFSIYRILYVFLSFGPRI